MKTEHVSSSELEYLKSLQYCSTVVVVVVVCVCVLVVVVFLHNIL